MSFDSTLTIKSFDPLFDLNKFEAAIIQQIEEDDFSMDVWDDLQIALIAGEAWFALPAISVLPYIEIVHQLAPEIDFTAECIGEEEDDRWVRQFHNGAVLLAVGP